ncbi:MAG: hypothetical protein PGN37_01210 [Mycobacterium kyogaense]|uniref:hypothetical protein n=1 Tax=Mycobacterium kyogaense TaxID=2212479 RepID=UPI002FF93FA7
MPVELKQRSAPRSNAKDPGKRQREQSSTLKFVFDYRLRDHLKAAIYGKGEYGCRQTTSIPGCGANDRIESCSLRH